MTKKLHSNDICWCGSKRKYKRCHKPVDDLRSMNRILPGKVSPMLSVPGEIAPPDYAASGEPSPSAGGLSIASTADLVERMRVAGRIAAEVLAEVGELVRPGITTDELDIACMEATIRRGAYPSPLNYHGYPKSICTSVNEVICHGIPDDRPLEDGDIVNLDVTCFIGGVHGDTNATYCVGEVDEDSRRLVEVTRECLERGIATVKPGALVRDIGQAIQAWAHPQGYGIVKAFVGHGIGTRFHTAPNIPHYYEPTATTELVPGMTFTIEPMITLGTWKHLMWDDDWTAVTQDHKRTAQFEHTLLVTDDGHEVLTR